MNQIAADRSAPPPAFLEDDPLYGDLLDCGAVRRLQNVRFLGAIEFFAGLVEGFSGTWGSRFEHTVGVAKLARQAASVLDLSKQQERVLVVSAMLHDIGHSPFSHSAEFFFKQRFGFDHRRVGIALLKADNWFARDVDNVLSCHRVKKERIVSILEGKDTELSFLFFSPINIDTIEGITRTLQLDLEDSSRYQEGLLYSLLCADPEGTKYADNFWRVKALAYNELIYAYANLRYEQAFVDALWAGYEKISADDFLLDDNELECKLAHEFRIAVDKLLSGEGVNPSKLPLRRRQLRIDRNVALLSLASFYQRYQDSGAATDVFGDA